jgi:WD40 repeat protein
MVRLWLIAGPQNPMPLGSPFKGNDHEVDSVACSRSGGVVALAGTATVTMWELAAQTPIPHGALVASHGQAVSSVTFSPDGKTLTAAADDGLVTPWDLTDPGNTNPLGPPLSAHGAPVPRSRSSSRPADNGYGERRQKMRLWDLRTPCHSQRPMAYALCADRTGLNPNEWKCQIPALPYQKTCPG